MLYIVIVSVISYFLGSVNTAIIISKSIYGSDIRAHGSKNPGATNMLRIYGKKAGAAVFFFDFSKGLLAVGLARCLILFFDAPYECILFAGFFAQLGHTLPCFYKFKGGKGVATAAGAAMGVMPLVAIILLVLFTAIVIISKTVSLSSGICAALYPLLAYFLSGGNAVYNFIFAALCAVMITVKHASNIGRLLDGTENKLSTD